MLIRVDRAGGAWDWRAVSGDRIDREHWSGKENDLVVRDARVSRQHVRLAWNGTGYTIQDLNSLNGTLVEGQRIAGPQALLNGDLIELAPGISLAFLARSYFSAS